MDYASWRLYFERVTGGPEAQINLAEAALVICGDEYPELDVDAYLEQLTRMADTVRLRLPSTRDPGECIASINRYLFDELGFTGNRAEYYDPRNSYLSDVLDRRTGLPISLSVVVLSLARQLELPIYGVGLPGHFVVKWQDAAQEIVFDPFDGGRTLGLDAIRARVRETFHAQAQFEPDWLDAVGSRYILFRMLQNLKSVFLRGEQTERAWQAVDKMLILDPRSGENIRDLGLLSLRLGAYRQAAISLEEYLLTHGDASDAAQMRLYLRVALEQVERLN